MPPHPRNSRNLNMELLYRLREAGGRFVPLDVLGDDSGQVRDDLDDLVEFGFQIERHPYQGAAYRAPAARLCPDQVEHSLKTRRIGRRIAVWNRVSSTSDLAARAALNLANDGLVVVAEEQTAGRGQRGRRWIAPPRSSILLSVLIFPPLDRVPSGHEAAAACGWLTALGAVATSELVSDWTGSDARIKWPNDVRVAGRKIAGILVERVRGTAAAGGVASSTLRGQGVVIGIGLNGNLAPEDFPAELRSTACSLSMLAGGPIDRSDIVRDLILRLDGWYDAVLQEGIGVLSEVWRDRSEHLGHVVRLATPGGALLGRLVDLDLRHGVTLDVSDGTADKPPECTARRIGPGHVLSLEAAG